MITFGRQEGNGRWMEDVVKILTEYCDVDDDDDEMKEDDKVDTCSTNGRDEKCIQNIRRES
jgi:hypothetical protein